MKFLSRYCILLCVISHYYNLRYDRKLGGDVTLQNKVNQTFEPALPTQQFGVTLQFIRNKYNVIIPPVVTQCIEYLENPDGMFSLFINSVIY